MHNKWRAFDSDKAYFVDSFSPVSEYFPVPLSGSACSVVKEVGEDEKRR